MFEFDVACTAKALFSALHSQHATKSMRKKGDTYGDANGAPHPQTSAYASKFTGRYAHRVIEGGVGHNLPQEAPGDFAQAIVDVGAF